MSEVRACAACGRLQSYAMPVCSGCGGSEIVACAVPFAAEIYSYTRVLRAPNPALQAEVPYTAVLVRGEKGGLLLLRWRDETTPEIGTAAQVQEVDELLVASRMKELA